MQLLEQAYQDTNGVALPLAEVAVNYAEVGQRAQALQFLDQALETVRKSQSRAVKFYELNEIAIKYAKVGQYDRAFQIVELINQWYPPNDADELELGGITRDALTEIAIQYAEAGRCDRALQLARRVRYQSNRAILI